MTRIVAASVAIATALGAIARADDPAPPLKPPSSVPPATPAVAEPVRRTSLLVEPLQFLFGSLVLNVEHQVIPHVSVTATAGIGYTWQLEVGDRVHWGYSGASLDKVYWVRACGGAQASYYIDHAFRGPHVGVDVAFDHFWATTGTGQSTGSFSVLTGSVYGGWKWMMPTGFTLTLQLGFSGVATTGPNGADDPGWHLYTEGTLHTLHLYGHLGAGWSL